MKNKLHGKKLATETEYAAFTQTHRALGGAPLERTDSAASSRRTGPSLSSRRSA